MNNGSINAIFNIIVRDATRTSSIDALKSDGLVKILPEPALVFMSGRRPSSWDDSALPILCLAER
jgi:Flp pilus assembly secretin CpaC